MVRGQGYHWGTCGRAVSFINNGGEGGSESSGIVSVRGRLEDNGTELPASGLEMLPDAVTLTAAGPRADSQRNSAEADRINASGRDAY